jgi:DNA-binding transcriptional MerR regulator
MVQVKGADPRTPDGALTISEVAARTGLAPSALRFYERRGLLKPVGRAGGKRTYSPFAVVQVAVVDLLKQGGFTLTEIARIVDADGRVATDWRDAARAKLIELEQQISFAQRAKLLIEHTIACPHPTPAQCPVFMGFVGEHVRSLEERASR